MNNLVLIKSEAFGTVKCDFYRDENKEILMTSEQLGIALNYANPRNGIGKIVERNPYLKKNEFSGVVKLSTPGGIQETRVFKEDGIYEVTFLANTERAREFREWVRSVLKALRKGEVQITPIQKNSIEAVKLVNQQVGMLIDSVEELGTKLCEVDKKIETQITISFNQAKGIQFAVKSRVINLLGGKGNVEYKEFKNRYFSAIHRDIKKRLGVPSYRDILKKDYAAALNYVESWLPEADIKSA